MISAPRHILLLFCNPVHLVTCYELPLYQPTPEESADPKLYAANVRRQMVRVRTCVRGRGGCVAVARARSRPSPTGRVQMTFGGLEDTTATYFDKIAFKEVLLERYGLKTQQVHAASKGE